MCGSDCCLPKGDEQDDRKWVAFWKVLSCCNLSLWSSAYNHFRWSLWLDCFSCVCMLCASHGSGQFMDCAAQGMDPCLICVLCGLSMDWTIKPCSICGSCNYSICIRITFDSQLAGHAWLDCAVIFRHTCIYTILTEIKRRHYQFLLLLIIIILLFWLLNIKLAYESVYGHT